MMGNNENKEVFDDYKKYVNKLGKEYEDIFKKIEIYINGTTKISETEKNNCLLQVLDTFLSAQEEGRVAEEVTGSSLRKYCESMIYGESLYIYKCVRIITTLIRTIFYIAFMHFFIRIGKGVFSEGLSIAFQPINFGIGEVILGISNISIPILLSIITQNLFEDPKRCKKIKRYVEYGVLIFAITIYTWLESDFGQSGITISFSRIILILIYSTIVLIVLSILFSGERLTSNLEQSEKKYSKLMIKKYKKYEVKCKKKNKDIMEWDDFLKKNRGLKNLQIIYFSICGIGLFVESILLAASVFIEGDIDLVGIAILLVITLLWMFIVETIRFGVHTKNSKIGNVI